MRVVLVDATDHREDPEDVVFSAYDPNTRTQEQVSQFSVNKFLEAFENSEQISHDEIVGVSGLNKTFRARGLYRSQGPEPFESIVFAIPLVDYKRELDFEDCYSIREYSPDLFNEAVPFMIQEIMKQEDYNILLNHIFPTRRLMSMASVFATSVVSGYNSMPTIFTSTKSSLASLVNVLGLGRRQRSELNTMSQDEFVKQLTENFPTDESNCIDFPSGFEDMFKRFFDELSKLILQMPSIIFRGVANQIDPAYKEMRQHYINCDINHLTYRGLKPAGTADYKLTNGLYLKGRQKYLITEDVDHLAGNNKGKYVPLTLGLASDLVYSFGAIPDFSRVAKRLGISIAKMVTYISTTVHKMNALYHN